MQIKFKKNINSYKYLVMFDLASRLTGVCLWDVKQNIPVKTTLLKTSKDSELPVANLYDTIDQYFNTLQQQGINLSDIVVYKEAMPVQLRGAASTVQTFIALAKSHAILDYYTHLHSIDVYDYVGIYPISTHSYLKHLNQWDNKHKVDKVDIQTYVKNTYGFTNISFDESDAIMLAKTFIEVKWNKDLTEEIKAIKKHCKELKTQHSIDACLEEIKRLQELTRA